MLTVRRSLTTAQRQNYSKLILDTLAAQPFYQRAHTVFCYAAMEDEVQTYALLRRALGEGKLVYLPYMTRQRGVMRAVRLPDMEALVPGACGILTVRNESEDYADPADIDCVIVPGAAFGRQGQRLGMGAGYYDRFLRKVHAFSVGICYTESITQTVPMQETDVRMDALACPGGILMTEVYHEGHL